MKRIITIGMFVSIFYLLSLFVSCSSPPEVTKVYKWKMHTFVPESANLYQGYMLPLIEELRIRSNGRLQITPYPVGAIVAPADLLLATAEGVVECAMATTGYDTGLIPEAYAATGLPYAWDNIRQPDEFWYNNKEAWDILDNAYMAKNIKLVALLSPADPLVFLTMFPVKGISDFKSKMIRSSGNWEPIVTSVGASQVTINLGELYPALEKGVVDGALTVMSVLSDFKLDEVIKYVILPPAVISSGADIIVNRDAFNELTPELQEMFVETAREMNLTNMIPYTEKHNNTTIANAKAKGVKFVTLPDSEEEKMRSAALEMWKNIEPINANTAKQVKLIREYLDSKTH